MSAKIGLKIPYSAIEDHLQCSICLSTIRGGVLTPCGHRYCGRCISEWADRHHTCPCCNSHLGVGQLYYDVQFDGLVDSILTARDAAEEEHFTQALGLSYDSGAQNAEAETSEETCLSNFQEILKNHMKSSLLSHKRYFDNLDAEFERTMRLLDMNQVDDKIVEKLLQSNNSISDIKDVLKENLEESKNLAAQAFDKYLKENVPSLELVPVSISIYIADKDVRLQNVIIHPNDTLQMLKPKIEEAMSSRSNKVLSWNDDTGQKLLYGPLHKSGSYDVNQIVHDVGKCAHPLHWTSNLVLQFSLRPASEIVLYNTFKSESDLPKKCFAKTYNSQRSSQCDYFTCSQCNVNWICKSCIQVCHAGHGAAPFALGHTPTWACCYCPKKKLCVIQDNN